MENQWVQSECEREAVIFSVLFLFSSNLTRCWSLMESLSFYFSLSSRSPSRTQTGHWSKLTTFPRQLLSRMQSAVDLRHLSFSFQVLLLLFSVLFSIAFMRTHWCQKTASAICASVARFGLGFYLCSHIYVRIFLVLRSSQRPVIGSSTRAQDSLLVWSLACVPTPKMPFYRRSSCRCWTAAAWWRPARSERARAPHDPSNDIEPYSTQH